MIGSNHKAIEALIAPSLAGMGYRLVRVRLASAPRPTLQIMAEPQTGAPMTIDGCAEVSRQISAVLEVENPIGGPYLLEVSSPGLDRPLVQPEDFQRYAGREVRIEAATAIEGRRRFKGQLAGATDAAARIVVNVDGEPREVEIAFENIAGAKLVLTDDMIKRPRDFRPGP